MENMEEKLAAVLGNPQMMQQIMTMAQSLSSQQEQNHGPPPDSSPPGMDFDPVMIQKLMNLTGQLHTDPQQRALLAALRPYLTDERINKLEKAMRAAKLANLASSALNSGALSFLTGR